VGVRNFFFENVVIMLIEGAICSIIAAIMLKIMPA